MKSFPWLKIKDRLILTPIIQGGMGVGVSLSPLASAVAREGGVGVISSACLDLILMKRNNKKKRLSIYDAVYEEISLAKQCAPGGVIGINIMVAISKHYADSVRASIDAGVDLIISGAGLPLSLPSIQKPGNTSLVPIISSARALEIICKKWEKLGYQPNAAVLEGPLAGGHLGFSFDEIYLKQNKLENLLLQVLDVAQKHGSFPVIVAGGIFTNADIHKFIHMGASGVQMGTRFLATEESSANNDYKVAVLECGSKNIVISDPKNFPPGSPCGLPLRILNTSPMFLGTHRRRPLCNKGYLLQKDEYGNYTLCPAKHNNSAYMCVCNGLCSSGEIIPEEHEPALWTVGENAHRVNRILTVRNLMNRLKGLIPED